MNIRFELKLKKKQKEIYDAVHNKGIRYVTAVLARQTGKSTLATVLIIEMLLTVYRAHVMYITPTNKLSRKVYKDVLSALRPTGLVKLANSTTLNITLTNSASLDFFSAESANSIRGQTCKGLLVIDEAAYMPETLPDGTDFFYNIILPTCTVFKPKILLISTPNGKQGIFYKYYLKGLEGDGETISVTGSIYDDESKEIEDIEKYKKEMPPSAWEQEYMCKFLDSPLTVFKGYEERFFPNVRTKGNVWVGIDLSSVGEDRTVVTLIDKWYNVEQFVIEGSIDMKYRKIASILNGRQVNRCLIEANGVGSPMINEIKKLTNSSKITEWITTNSNKKEMIGELIMKIADGVISFDEENKLLRRELGVFTYSIRNGKVFYSAPAGLHDDTVMSLAIALQARESYQPMSFDDFHAVKTRNKTFG